jgi:hypothetical protein
LNQAILQGMALEAKYRPQSIEAWLALLTPYESDTDDLSSEVGVDYRKLRDFLKAGKWQEADRETVVVICQAANREEEGLLRIEDIEKFPCTDLRTIDRLWVKYSNGRFGFSVQKRIWESVGGTPDADYETFCCFGEIVGWRVNQEWQTYSEFTFNKNANEGHLPCVWGSWEEINGLGLWGECEEGHLFSRVETCRV